MVSPPPRPTMTSAAGVPLSTSGLAVPTFVAVFPKHKGVAAPAGVARPATIRTESNVPTIDAVRIGTPCEVRDLAFDMSVPFLPDRGGTEFRHPLDIDRALPRSRSHHRGRSRRLPGRAKKGEVQDNGEYGDPSTPGRRRQECNLRTDPGQLLHNPCLSWCPQVVAREAQVLPNVQQSPASPEDNSVARSTYVDEAGETRILPNLPEQTFPQGTPRRHRCLHWDPDVTRGTALVGGGFVVTARPPRRR